MKYNTNSRTAPKHAKAAIVSPTPLHKTLKARATAAITAGCLALTLCPAAAMAAPMDGQMPGQGETPQAAQQGFFDAGSFEGAPTNGEMPEGFAAGGQAPSGEASDGQAPQGMPIGEAPEGQAPQGAPTGEAPEGQAPSGQAPQGAPTGDAPDGQAPQGAPDGQMPGGEMPGGGPRMDAIDDAVRDVLSSSFGFEAPSFPSQDGEAPQFGEPGEAPEIPEGGVNPQQVIDSVRDILRSYDLSELEAADFTDEEFSAELAAFIQKADDERHEMFSNGQKPSDMKPGQRPAEAPDGEAPESGEAPEAGEAPASGEAPDAAQQEQASDALVASLVDFVMGVYGYSA